MLLRRYVVHMSTPNDLAGVIKPYHKGQIIYDEAKCAHCPYHMVPPLGLRAR